MTDDTPVARQPVTLRGFFRNFTWEKGHALTYGATLLFLAAAAASVYVFAGFVAIVLWALGIRSSPYRHSHTGDKKRDPIEGDLHELDPETAVEYIESLPVHRKVLLEIRHKPHYFIGGGVVGDRLGYVFHYLVHGVPPDHYSDIPEIVSMLVL